jgi:hypothetical protein
MILRALAVSAVFFTAPASAALYDWTNGDSVSTTDSTNYNLGPGSTVLPWRNITKFWFASDDDNAYFRMDLAGGPGTDFGSSDALMYAIYIDSIPNSGGDGSDSTYLYDAGGYVTGIDWIIDIHYDSFGNILTNGQHVHEYTGLGSYQFDVSDYASNGVEIDILTSRLDWSAPLDNFGMTTGNFIVYAATYEILVGGTDSYDLAQLSLPAEAPVPASWLLLAPGLLLLGRFRRRAA